MSSFPSSNRAPSAAPQNATASRAPIASRYPLLLGVIATAASLALAIFTATTATVQQVWTGLSLPLADPSTLALSIGGYLLATLTTIGAMAWDRTAQTLGLRDRNFVLKPQYQRALRWLVGAGFVVALWHIFNIASAVAGAS